MHVFQRMHYLEKREEVSQSLCIHLMVDVSESAAQALGIAEGALERTIEYTKERKQFGRSIAQQREYTVQACRYGYTYRC